MRTVKPLPPRDRRNVDQPSDDRPVDTRPYLSIPYWKAPRFPGDQPDDGELRPLPAGVISWDCQSIHAGPYSPGSALDVSVDVRNAGGGNTTAVATVIIYWADPTVGFANPNFFAVKTVAVPPRGGLATTGTLSAVIPAGAPNHICLLAVVTNPLDKAGVVCDPLGDRHWAQRNLQSITTSAGMPVIVPFFVRNPFASEKSFELRAQVLKWETLQLLALRTKAQPSDVRSNLQLLNERGQPVTDVIQEPHTSVALGAQKGRLYHVAIRVEGELDPSELTAIEMVLYLQDAPTKPVGSLGIVIRGREHET